MLNPWVLLAVGVAWLASCGSAYLYGSHTATNAAKVAHGTALENAIKDANADAKESINSALKAAESRQKTRIEYRDRVQTIVETVNANPTSCNLPDGYRLRINDAIDAANNRSIAGAGKLPAAAEIGK